jgi:hypothetical protein
MPSKKPTLSRKKAYIETDGVLFRIRKGALTSPWARPSEVASLQDDGRTYFAFAEPLAAIFPHWKANVVYFSVPCKTEEKIITGDFD